MFTFMVLVAKMPKTREECEYYSNVQGCTRTTNRCKCTFYDADAAKDKSLKGVRFCDHFIDLKSYQKMDRKFYDVG